MSGEVNYKKDFIDRYYNIKKCKFDINYADVILLDNKGSEILYIESKPNIPNEQAKRKALAQAVLTNKKQNKPLTRCAVIFADKDDTDTLIEIDCSDNSVLYNNDINWAKETPSNPTADAIARINDRISGRLTEYKGEEIAEYFKALAKGKETQINITRKNFTAIYHQWEKEISFGKKIDEQDKINLYIVDILNGTKYEDVAKERLFSVGFKIEGTEINAYEIEKLDGGKRVRFLYDGKRAGIWNVLDVDKYNAFWQKYKRPPEFDEFCYILEHSAQLYTEQYRRTTGAEYTPSCFVQLQNLKLRELGYNMDDFIVFDPCCGVGNLENDFGRDYKDSCYMSTLEQMDVDTCISKGFENVIQYDFLKDDNFPQFKYKGTKRTISEICTLEHKKLMVIMNPPYQRTQDKKSDLAIEFYNKCVKLKPQVIVYYFKTERFLSDDIKHYIKSGYKIQSHVMSNAKTTFLLSEWPISQVIFDKDTGTEIDRSKIEVERYEVDRATDILAYIKNYSYNMAKPDLITEEIEKHFKTGDKRRALGGYCYLRGSLYVGVGNAATNIVTPSNIEYCLLSKGLNFNTDDKYFERNKYVYRGKFEDIPKELYNDAIMFSLFYLNFGFTNKDGYKNYIMPFTAEELGCNKNDLNVLIETESAKQANLFDKESGAPIETKESEPPFDFRKFMKQFDFSQEAKDLYFAALEVFKYYHACPNYDNKDWNDSFYDVTNAIMGKGRPSADLDTENDTRINKVKTTKGTKGFGRNTIKYAVESQYLPIFEDLFNKRDILAKKINRQLVDSGLLLWERENIY